MLELVPEFKINVPEHSDKIIDLTDMFIKYDVISSINIMLAWHVYISMVII
jgi:hypothetical protein